MKILKSVLLAIDFNDEQDSLLERVSTIAHLFGNKIILLHVISGELKGTSIRNLVEKYVENELKTIQDTFAFQGIKEVETTFSYGNTVDEIIDVSEKENVNTIIVGSGEKSDQQYPVLGLNALQVIRNSRKTVIVIRSKEKGPVNQIVCPVDCSEPSRLSLKTSILTAKKINAKLSVIGVFEPLFITSPRLLSAGIDEQGENKIRYAAFEKKFKTFMKEFDFLELDYDTHILSGNIPEEILNFVKNNKIDLMCMGSAGKTGIRRRLMGSVTEKVIREISCHVLVTKSEEVFKLHIATEIEDIEIHYKRAKELNELGYYQEALREYNICIGINDMHIPAIKSLTALYEKLGEKEQARYYQDLADTIIRKLTDKKIEEEIRRQYRSGK